MNLSDILFAFLKQPTEKDPSEEKFYNTDFRGERHPVAWTMTAQEEIEMNTMAAMAKDEIDAQQNAANGL